MAFSLKYSPKEKLPSISKKVWWRLVKPTFSRSLCLPPARTHFCAVVARVYSRFSRPRKTSLNWFIPAFVNSRVASPCGTSDELRTRRCPLPSKKRRNPSRISFPLQNFLLTDSPVTSASVLQDSIPRLSQTQHTPATNPESGRGPVSDCASYWKLGRRLYERRFGVQCYRFRQPTPVTGNKKESEGNS